MTLSGRLRKDFSDELVLVDRQGSVAVHCLDDHVTVMGQDVYVDLHLDRRPQFAAINLAVAVLIEVTHHRSITHATDKPRNIH